MDYCLLQFEVLKFFSGVHVYGGSQPNFNFFNVNPQIFRRNRKVHLINCLETIFMTFLTIVLELLDIGVIANTNL